jgi:diacylglycerol kinase family enzyme
MQVLLVVNQYASTTNLGQLPALVECLATTFEVATQHTQSPGHARELAAGAADSGFEAVLTWGGDGTAS